MGRYVLSRFAQAIPVLVLSSIVIFLVLYLAPGDPATSLAGTEATPAQVAQLRHHLGLDKPLWHQYLLWANRVLHGDFGHSYLNQLPTLSLIWGRVPASAELAGAALAITLLVGIPLGILTSLRPGGLIDRGMSATTAVMIAVPNFWLGIIGILLFGIKLGWLPVGGYVTPSESFGGWAKALVLPAVALAVEQVAILTRFVRTGMVETHNADFMRTAKSKGLPRRIVVTRHQFRNSLTPVITVLGLHVGRLMGGAVVIETVFAWPGLGRLLAQSVQDRDYAVVQGIMLLLVVWFVLVNLLTDLAYGWSDPRMRVARRGPRIRDSRLGARMRVTRRSA